jgi:hypothetical protein
VGCAIAEAVLIQTHFLSLRLVNFASSGLQGFFVSSVEFIFGQWGLLFSGRFPGVFKLPSPLFFFFLPLLFLLVVFFFSFVFRISFCF